MALTTGAKHGQLQKSLDTKQRSIDDFRTECAQLAGINLNGSAISTKGDAVFSSWAKLIAASEERREGLLQSQETYSKLEDLHLEFAKKASGFNS